MKEVIKMLNMMLLVGSLFFMAYNTLIYFKPSLKKTYQEYVYEQPAKSNSDGNKSAYATLLSYYSNNSLTIGIKTVFVFIFSIVIFFIFRKQN